MSQNNISKFDADVAAFCETESDDSLSVLIEIVLPQSMIRFPSPRPGKTPAAEFPQFSQVADPDEVQARVDSAREALGAILDSNLNWLRAPQVFVADATREELASVAQQDFVRRISLNRPLKQVGHTNG